MKLREGSNESMVWYATCAKKMLEMLHVWNITVRARATLGYREKKNVPRSRYVSHVYYAVYIYSYCIGNANDYYFQVIIEVAQLRQHEQRLNDLRMQLG